MTLPGGNLSNQTYRIVDGHPIADSDLQYVEGQEVAIDVYLPVNSISFTRSLTAGDATVKANFDLNAYVLTSLSISWPDGTSLQETWDAVTGRLTLIDIVKANGSRQVDRFDANGNHLSEDVYDKDGHHVFGEGFGSGGALISYSLSDPSHSILVNLDQASNAYSIANGAGKVIESPCRSCRGEGRVDKPKTLSVNIPAGVDEGTRIRLSGEGEAGARGAPAGDLYIFLHVKRHAIFERDGTTLFARAPVSITTAALGGVIEVPGLDGQRHEIKIPSGIQSGKQIRQRGAGMPVLNGRGQGDLVIQVDVETPTKLTAKQRELLEAFRETETGEECPQSTGFFSKLKELWGD